MNRLLNLLEYALLSLFRKKGKNLSLLLIYACVVAFFASIVFLTTALKYESQNVISDLPELWIQKITGGRLIPVEKALADSISAIRGVSRVIPRIWGYYYDSPTGAVFSVVGSDSSITGLYRLKSSESRFLDSTTVLCGTGFLKSHYLATGQRLSLFNSSGELKSFEIIGRFDSESDLLTRDIIVLSSGAARDILGLAQNQATDIAVRISNPSEVENIGLKINRKFSGLRVVTREELLLTYEALFSWRGGIFVFGGLISLLAFLILIWDRASGLSREDRKELGILKGIGWQINDVLLIKFWEGIILSVTATLLGMILAYIHIFIMNAWLLKPFFIGWSVIYPDYNLRPVIDLGSILIIFLISVIPYLSASVIPAWKGAITDPAEVMQNG